MAIPDIIIHNGKWYPVQHLFIYREFKKHSLNNLFIDFDCVREILRRRQHKIPQILRYSFLKELENPLGLIRRVGSSRNIRFELIGKDIDNLLNQYNVI